MFEDNGGLVAATESAPIPHQPPSVTEKLLTEKKELELRLEAVNKLLVQLEENPGTRQIIDELSKLGHLGRHY